MSVFRKIGVALPVLFVVGCTAGTDAESEDDAPENEEVASTQQGLSDAYRLEAEHLQSLNGYPRAIEYGYGASGNAFWALRWTGAPVGQFYVNSAGWYRIAPRLYGMHCDGAPYAYFNFDWGKHILGNRTLPQGWSYPVSDWAYLGAGWHQFAVGFGNDHATSYCDRNIWFDYVVIQKY